MKSKTKNYTLSVEMKATQKEMLSSYPNVLRTLHYSNGFNYQKPYRIYKHQGKFTINSLAKLYNIDYKRDIVVALSVYCSQWDMRDINEKEKEPRKELYLFELQNGDNIYSNDLYVRTGINKSNVNDFEKKEDFNSVRKSDNSIIYIIVQEEQYRDSIEPREINKYMDCFDRYFPLLKGFEHFKFRNVFDKSGYNVDAFRYNLHQRLNDLKMEKDRKSLNHEEVKKQFNYHSNNITDLKAYISNKLDACDTCDTELLNKISSVLESLSDYSHYVNALKENKRQSLFEHFNYLCDREFENLKDMCKILEQ